MASSNNPRKFSEKIALHNQKQAEETAAFEEVMKDLNVTRAARVRSCPPGLFTSRCLAPSEARRRSPVVLETRWKRTDASFSSHSRPRFAFGAFAPAHSRLITARSPSPPASLGLEASGFSRVLRYSPRRLVRLIMCTCALSPPLQTNVTYKATRHRTIMSETATVRSS